MFYFEETPVTGCAVQAGPQQEDANPSRQGFSVVIQKVWYLRLKNGKKEFSINITDDNSKNISKNRLQKMVKKLAVIGSFDYLNKLKNKYSKLDNITVDNLKPRQYLSDKKNEYKSSETAIQIKNQSVQLQTKFSKLAI